MRHRKHNHQLGVKKEHRLALMANLASALFTHGRIQTTLAKAKALRPFAEKLITKAKRAHMTDDEARKLHLYRTVISRIRDKRAAKILFEDRAAEFVDRPGGYTRIYKLGSRRGDSAPMALIEMIDADDEGYEKRPRKSSAKSRSKPKGTDVSAEKEPTSALPDGGDQDQDSDSVVSND